jgi:hypothetical protein
MPRSFALIPKITVEGRRKTYPPGNKGYRPGISSNDSRKTSPHVNYCGGSIFDETIILNGSSHLHVKVPKTGEQTFRGHCWLREKVPYRGKTKFSSTKSCYTFKKTQNLT